MAKDTSHIQPRASGDVYTVGHSTRTFEEFVELLHGSCITLLLDIRSVPRSRRVPQFNREALGVELPRLGIYYRHEPALGGFRHTKLDESLNGAWRNDSFRAFADYMQTDEFARAVDVLVAETRNTRIALMCAEAVPWRCHRSLVADALIIRGLTVHDLIGSGRSSVHQLTSFAVVDGIRLTYPSTE